MADRCASVVRMFEISCLATARLARDFPSCQENAKGLIGQLRGALLEVGSLFFHVLSQKIVVDQSAEFVFKIYEHHQFLHTSRSASGGLYGGRSGLTYKCHREAVGEASYNISNNILCITVITTWTKNMIMTVMMFPILQTIFVSIKI